MKQPLITLALLTTIAQLFGPLQSAPPPPAQPAPKAPAALDPAPPAQTNPHFASPDTIASRSESAGQIKEPSGGKYALTNGVTAPTADPVRAVAIENSYCLREGDTIEIRVFQEEDLTARVRLSKEGEVTLPLLGPVTLGGKSIEQARRQVQTALEKDYLVNPQVTITVVDYAKRRFSVMGQVQQPGFYNIPENETLNILQAISMAGGFTALANTSRVNINRVINGEQKVIQVNVRSMGTENGSKLVEVLAEDAIIVSQKVF
jgi:protein involved in polysaccharide export with SLBB domain